MGCSVTSLERSRNEEDPQKAAMDARQELYRALATQICNPENLLREVDA